MASLDVPDEVLAAAEQRIAGCVDCRRADPLREGLPANSPRYLFLAALVDAEYQRLRPAEWQAAVRSNPSFALPRPLRCPGCGRRLELHATVLAWSDYHRREPGQGH